MENEVSKITTAPVEKVHNVPECQLSLNNRAELLKEIERRSVDLASRSLYLAPVPVNCSLNLLKQLSPSVLACRLSYNSHAKTCRKYAFLEYADSQSANAARKSLMGRLFAGRTVTTQAGRPQYLATQGSECVRWKEVFVTGLHQTTTKADLQQAFPKAQEVDYPFHARGHPLGYAIIKFVNEDVAFEGFVNAHKRVIKGQPIFVNYVISGNKNPKTDKTESPALSASILPTQVPVPDNPILELKRPISSSISPGPAAKKPKVLIRPIHEEVADTEDSATQSNFSLEGLDVGTDDFLIRPASSKVKPVAKQSHVLSQLVQSRKVSLSKKPESHLDDEIKDDEDADPSTTSESDSCESLAGDSTDPDSASLSEENDNDDEEYEEVEDIGDEDDGDESKDVMREKPQNGLFQCPPTAEEQTALDASEDSLGEEVDNALGTVIHARRSAMRALKNAGSSKRAWSASGTSKGQKVQRSNKGFKPFMLPMPSKRS